jgi:hypothetical protein
VGDKCPPKSFKTILRIYAFYKLKLKHRVFCKIKAGYVLIVTCWFSNSKAIDSYSWNTRRQVTFILIFIRMRIPYWDCSAVKLRNYIYLFVSSTGEVKLVIPPLI